MSLQADKSFGHLGESLIDWCTPPMVKHSTFNRDIINNPFDKMELMASNMDPFDLDTNETPANSETESGNLWSPLWKINSKPLRKSVSLTDINGIAKIVKHVKENHSTDDATLVCLDEAVNQSKENCVTQLIEENNKIENEEHSTELVLTMDHHCEIDIEKHSLCNEDEKKKIREETRQRIQKLIEKAKTNYEVNELRNTLLCTPIRNSSLNDTESLFNRGFVHSGSNNTSNSYIERSNKSLENVFNSDSNKSNLSVLHSESQLKSFDLNSLEPEWISDIFSDSDGIMEDQTDTLETTGLPYKNIDKIDIKLKALNRIGIIESKPNGCRNLLSTQNDKPQNKGPFLANVPLEQMIQNCTVEETKEIIHGPISPRVQIKPVASSTPTLNVAVCKTPSTIESSIKSRPSISRRSMPNSVERLNTPLNVTKCMNKMSTFDVDGNKSAPLSANKRSNTTIVLLGRANERNSEKIQSYKLNKSKSLSKIGKIPKPLALNTNKISGLPVPKRPTMSFVGKENLALQ